MDLLNEIDLRLDLLEGRMGTEKTKEFLQRDLSDPIPAEWGETLRLHDDLMSEDSTLYRLFWYAGLRDYTEMERLVLTLFYLRYHAKRLP